MNKSFPFTFITAPNAGNERWSGVNDVKNVILLPPAGLQSANTKKIRARVPCVSTWWLVKIYCIYLFIVIVIWNCVAFSCFPASHKAPLFIIFATAIHILWRGSLLDDSCLSGRRFTIAIGLKGAIEKFKLQGNAEFPRHIKWQFRFGVCIKACMMFCGDSTMASVRVHKFRQIYTWLSFSNKSERNFWKRWFPLRWAHIIRIARISNVVHPSYANIAVSAPLYISWIYTEKLLKAF